MSERAQALEALQERIGYRFKDTALLEQALTHRSFGSENDTGDNERLEFLGDAVLDTIVADLLMNEDTEAHEGDLSRRRAALVSESSLASIARSLGLEDHIRLGKGEQSSGGRDKPRLLCSAYEAVIGAVFRDGGYDAAQQVAFGQLRELLSIEAGHINDNKTALQELTQQRFRVIPNYEVLEVEGPDHEPHYRVKVSVSGETVATGSGGSRKAAEQKAAGAALERYTGEPGNDDD